MTARAAAAESRNIPVARPEETQPADAAPERDPRECVVGDGTAHMGRATPGAVICSAHAMRYRADGTPRA